MGAVIAFANHKGGVAKTTSTWNISLALKALGHTVLVIDLDPHASLTIVAGQRPVELEELGKTITAVLVNGFPMKDVVRHSERAPSLVPSSLDLGQVEIGSQEKFALNVLKQHVDDISDDYDFVLIDCLPSMGVLFLNGLVAADGILIPAKTDMLSISGVDALIGSIQSIRMEENPDVEIIGCIPTNHTARNNVDREALRYLKKLFKGIARVFEPVPHSTVFERCLLEGKAVPFNGINARGRPYMIVAEELVKIYA